MKEKSRNRGKIRVLRSFKSLLKLLKTKNFNIKEIKLDKAEKI